MAPGTYPNDRPMGRGRDYQKDRAMNIALGQWIATMANQRAQHSGQTPVQELAWMLEWVDVYEGAYRALGAPYGDDDDGLLRWLKERAPLPQAH
jgi:hypothetical protein